MEKKEINIKELNIFEKLSLITSELGTIQKNLKVSTGSSSYKAVSERDILDAIKPIEEKYRVFSYPFQRNILDTQLITKKTEYKDQVKETNSFMIRLEVIYRFVNIDKPDEFIEIASYGDGIDTGDKAPGKCMTYADKYALMKCYKISTGDDPEQEASAENGYNVSSSPKRNQKNVVNNQNDSAPNQQITPITKEQLDFLYANIDVNNMKDWLKKTYGVETYEQMTSEEAQNLINLYKKKKNKN